MKAPIELTPYQKDYLDGHRAGRRGELAPYEQEPAFWQGFLAGRKILDPPVKTSDNRKVDYENP